MKLTENAMNEIRKNAKFLKITVEIGGCAGFQYDLEYTNHIPENFFLANEFIVTDQESLNLIENIELDFLNELGFEEYKIINPKAKKSCGCGNSFA